MADRVQVAGDVLSEYLDPESDLFFAAVPSADWVLAEVIATAETAG